MLSPYQNGGCFSRQMCYYESRAPEQSGAFSFLGVLVAPVQLRMEEF